MPRRGGNARPVRCPGIRNVQNRNNIRPGSAPPHLRTQEASAIVEAGSGGLCRECTMSYRSLALAVAALSSIPIASAEAQSVYVAPGGVYVANGPVYVTPAPNLPPPAPYVAPSAGYYGPPAVVAPAPPVVAPTVVYEPNGGYYN